MVGKMFKKGDKLVYIGVTTDHIVKGNYYTILNVYNPYDGVVELVDEHGERDIYHGSLFEYDKNRIVKDILEDL